MSELTLAFTYLLLVAGVVGTVVPAVPGVLLSFTGVAFYWWSTGYSQPSTPFVAAILILTIATVLLDWFAPAVSSRVAETTKSSVAASAIVGFLLLFTTGPIGFLAGVTLTVFMIELYKTGNKKQSLKSAIVTTAGILALTVFQLIVAVAILLAFTVTLLI